MFALSKTESKRHKADGHRLGCLLRADSLEPEPSLWVKTSEDRNSTSQAKSGTYLTDSVSSIS